MGNHIYIKIYIFKIFTTIKVYAQESPEGGKAGMIIFLICFNCGKK